MGSGIPSPRPDVCSIGNSRYSESHRLAATRTACYKSLMKIIERWLLYKYVGGEFTPLSKPFKTKEQAEWARMKYPERERGAIGLGVIRIEK